MAKDTPRIARQQRHARAKAKVKGTTARPRLCVFRSLHHIYAQVIDDTIGHTMAASSTLDPEIKAEMNGKNKTGRSELVGTLIAKGALASGVTEVAFDRGGFKYHGRIKALAEAARKQGLKF